MIVHQQPLGPPQDTRVGDQGPNQLQPAPRQPSGNGQFNPPHWQQFAALQQTYKPQPQPQAQQQYQPPPQQPQLQPQPQQYQQQAQQSQLQPQAQVQGQYQQQPQQPQAQLQQQPQPQPQPQPQQYQQQAPQPQPQQYQLQQYQQYAHAVHTPNSITGQYSAPVTVAMPSPVVAMPPQYQTAGGPLPHSYYPPATIMVPVTQPGSDGSNQTPHMYSTPQSSQAYSMPMPSTYLTSSNEILLVPAINPSQMLPPQSDNSSLVAPPTPSQPLPLPSALPTSDSDDATRLLDICQGAPRRPKLGPDLEASCPLIGSIPRGAIVPQPLPITSLKVDAQVSIASVVVEFELEVLVPTWVKSSHRLVLYSPRQVHTTMTNLTIVNLDHPKPQIATMALVPQEEVQHRGWGFARPQLDYNEEGGPDRNDPELFIYNVPFDFAYKAGHKLKVNLMYFEPLTFYDGQYIMRLPTTMPPMCIPEQKSVQSILQIKAVVNTGLPTSVHADCYTHPANIDDSEPGVVEVTLDTTTVLTNLDFELSYKVWGPVITAACFVMPPRYTFIQTPATGAHGLIGTNGSNTIPPAPPASRPRREVPLLATGPVNHLPTFILTAAPQNPDCCDAFPRSVVFLLDRSGSMTGEPLAFAVQAIHNGLAMLQPEDMFTICAFDHEMLWWNEELVAGSRENVAEAGKWMTENVNARGLTDMLNPINRAMELLQGSAQQLPFVFLITDGCVQEEREICNVIDSLLKSGEAIGQHRPRINTFAIGPYANHFFLSHIAAMARGFFDVAFRPYAIKQQMERMLMACAQPNLSDIHVSVPGLEANDVGLLPSPVPDLFCGRPLLLIGKFDGKWPDKLVLSGLLPDGKPWDQEVVSSNTDSLPLDKMWAKEYLHRETALAWRNDDRHAIDRIIHTSIATGVPCAYTQMVGFTTTPEGYQQLQADRRAGRISKVTKYAIGGAAGVALVVGAAAVLSFGDVANTLANLPSDIMAGFGDLGDCCGCCADCCGAIGGCSIS